MHLDDATALAFAAGSLPAGAFDEALAHVDGCADCRRLVAAAAGAGTRGPPATIGRFTVEAVAGHGAMGIVYRARDPRLDRPVAIKTLRGDVFAGEARARFEREARALARVDHPNVVRVFEVGEHDGELFLAMELVDGLTVEEWLTSPRRPADIVAVFVQAAEGLLAAHQAGLVHRDFKPANAMIDAAGRVRVTDFGLVHVGGAPPAVAANAASPASQATRDVTAGDLTRTGVLLGTPAYLAPELLAAALGETGADGPGPRADQFSLCVALFEALAGHRPFAGRDLRELRAAHERGPEPPRRPIPRRVHRALRRGLALSPAGRFPSLRELIEAITPPARGRRLAIAVAAGATAAVIAGGWALARDRSPAATPPRPAATAAGACPAADARHATLVTDARATAARRAVAAAWPATPPPGTHPDAAARWPALGRLRGTLVVDGARRLADAWRSQYAPVCTGAAAEVRLRRACLDDVAGRLDALLADPPGSALADELRGLDAELDRCATHLVSGLDLPRDEAEAVVAAARAELATAAALRLRGQLPAATAAVERAIAAGTRAGSSSLLAEAWLERGLLARDAGEVQPSLDAWHEAMAAAHQVSHHRVLRRAADELAAQYALGARDRAEAERWLRTAASLDGKVPPSDGERATRLLARAALATEAGDHAAARALLAEAAPLAGPPGAPLADRIARAAAAAWPRP